ncbi:MAG: helix-turn-helix transcriptional regulator [Desulfosarcina sp.]|nr:helix-turn-helix transcriptional regulator [Desulfobacterales bacterium]
MPKQLPKKDAWEEGDLRTKKKENFFRLTSRSALDIINSLSAHIAILDHNGTILATNGAWADFAKANKIRMRPDMVNANYLEICDRALSDSAENAGKVSEGIRALIEKKIDEFAIEYPCHSSHEKRWFYMRATRLSDSRPIQVVISHENITALKKAEEELRKKQAELKLQRQDLEETNTALKVLLKQREGDKHELEESMVSNIKELVFPYLAKLHNARLDSSEKTYLDIIESHLNEIVSPLLRKLSSRYLNLTPQEIQVAYLVKDGKRTKEISQILFISEHTVNFHRKRIREKLGLKKKSTSMRAFLLSLEE